MKRTIQLILCLACLIIFSMPTTSAQLSLIEDGARIEVNFNSTLAAKDLEKIKADLATRGIEVNYTLVNYNKKGYLRGIAFEVKTEDDFSGTASHNRLTQKSRFGFFRDYREGVTAVFGTGSLE